MDPKETLRGESDRLGRLIAFYLPQFHPIPDNDEAWEPGFTEWTNVTRARPRYPGHPQPHLPRDLGFYDLRNPATLCAQTRLAAEYGIDGFFLYHYWFGGRRLLGRPLDLIRANKSIRLPFAVCWANENWTRRWHGGDDDVLVHQAHSDLDDERHGRWLASLIGDSRYIRLDGAALIGIYKPSLLPHPARTAERFRSAAEKAGTGPIHLTMVESTEWERSVDPLEIGFDSSIDFFPDWTGLGSAQRSLGIRVRNRLARGAAVYDYAEVAINRISKPLRADPPRFPCVSPGWDNTPRRSEGAVVLHGASPVLYERWLTAEAERVMKADFESPVVFVNAWNEWAEGASLEPSQRFGRAFLNSTLRSSTRLKP